MELFPRTRTTLSGNLSAGALVLAAFVIYAIVGNNGYLLSVGTTISMTAIAVIGLSLVIGRAGQLNFGQAGFMALGAYLSAWVTRDWHFNFLLGILVGALSAGVVGLLVGVIALRLRGNYLAMATLGTGAIIFGLFSVNSPFGGPNGFSSIPTLALGPLEVTSPMGQYIFCGVALGIVYVFSVWLLSTRFGRELAALRDDEVGALALGIPVVARKVEIFTLSAVMAGIAGSIDAALQTTIDPGLFAISVSLQLFLMVVLGGLGSVPGAVFGTALVLGILQVVPGTGDHALVVMGAAVIVAMTFFAGGLAGILRQGDRPAAFGLSKLGLEDLVRRLGMQSGTEHR